MKISEFTFMRIFFLRRRVSGITPSERIKAAAFISGLDAIWILNLLCILNLCYEPITNSAFIPFLYLAIIIISLNLRDRQLTKDNHFKQIMKDYEKIATQQKYKWLSTFYIVVPLSIFILLCILIHNK